MKLETMIEQVHPTSVVGPREGNVTGVTEDSRQVRPGYAFVALPGVHQDGWSFVEDAAERGAAAVISEHEGQTRQDICFVRVADAHMALAEAACAFFGRPADGLQMLGVTGTNGKTTIAYMLRCILHADGRAPGVITTVSYEIGERAIPASRTTPQAPVLQSLLADMLRGGCRSCVMEVSSHALVQKRTAGIDYDVAIFTNLTRDHLDYHEDMAQYFEAKRRLFLSLGRQRKQAVAVVNCDDPWGCRLADDPEV
jgi:UDP-N-acetylmuramoyl-L-alanyl-D-glutamate--2,6-diaminopimelate ligase